MKNVTRALCFLAALILALGCTVYAEQAPDPAEGSRPDSEEQGLQEIQQLMEISEVENTEGMSLEELTDAVSGNAMSDYQDGVTGFTMQYPSIFQFDEEADSLIAFTADRQASLTIENMANEGGLTEDILLEAIRMETPDAKPQKNEQNGCLRVDHTEEGSCRTELYLLTEKSFHHITIVYPAAEQNTFLPYIEYMINTMGTKDTDQG